MNLIVRDAMKFLPEKNHGVLSESIDTMVDMTGTGKSFTQLLVFTTPMLAKLA